MQFQAGFAGRWDLARRTQCERGLRCRSYSVRKAKDPKEWGSIEELRADLEGNKPGLFTGLVQWLSSAANTSATGFDLRVVYQKILSFRKFRKDYSSWGEEQEALDELEARAVLQMLCGQFAGCLRFRIFFVRHHTESCPLNHRKNVSPMQRQIGCETVRQLSVVLLGTRKSTLRIIRRHRPVLEMERAHIMQRLVWLKVCAG